MSFIFIHLLLLFIIYIFIYIFIFPIIFSELQIFHYKLRLKWLRIKDLINYDTNNNLIKNNIYV